MEAVEVLEDAVLVVEHAQNFPNITVWLGSKRARRRRRRTRSPTTDWIPARRWRPYRCSRNMKPRRDRGVQGDRAPAPSSQPPPVRLAGDHDRPLRWFPSAWSAPACGGRELTVDLFFSLLYICGAGFGGLPAAGAVEHLAEAFLGQVLVGVLPDLHHRRVQQAPRHSTSSQEKLPSVRQLEWIVMDAVLADLDQVAGAAQPHGVVPQTWTCAFLPTGESWNIV